MKIKEDFRKTKTNTQKQADFVRKLDYLLSINNLKNKIQIVDTKTGIEFRHKELGTSIKDTQIKSAFTNANAQDLSEDFIKQYFSKSLNDLAKEVSKEFERFTIELESVFKDYIDSINLDKINAKDIDIDAFDKKHNIARISSKKQNGEYLQSQFNYNKYKQLFFEERLYSDFYNTVSSDTDIQDFIKEHKREYSAFAQGLNSTYSINVEDSDDNDNTLDVKVKLNKHFMLELDGVDTLKDFVYEIEETTFKTKEEMDSFRQRALNSDRMSQYEEKLTLLDEISSLVSLKRQKEVQNLLIKKFPEIQELKEAKFYVDYVQNKSVQAKLENEEMPDLTQHIALYLVDFNNVFEGISLNFDSKIQDQISKLTKEDLKLKNKTKKGATNMTKKDTEGFENAIDAHLYHYLKDLNFTNLDVDSLTFKDLNYKTYEATIYIADNYKKAYEYTFNFKPYFEAYVEYIHDDFTELFNKEKWIKELFKNLTAENTYSVKSNNSTFILKIISDLDKTKIIKEINYPDFSNYDKVDYKGVEEIKETVVNKPFNEVFSDFSDGFSDFYYLYEPMLEYYDTLKADLTDLMSNPDNKYITFLEAKLEEAFTVTFLSEEAVKNHNVFGEDGTFGIDLLPYNIKFELKSKSHNVIIEPNNLIKNKNLWDTIMESFF